MNILLSKLTLVNFKGVKNHSIDFTSDTTISGRNETGKTTIMDAFLWCLFGKDHEDRKDYEIKNTVDRSLNKADHHVTAVFYIDGRKQSFARLYKEKWVKRRGEIAETFTGHETEYFIDLVPVSQRDYNDAVNSILPVDNFKLLTNPFYFSSLNWKDRREMLTQLVGSFSDRDIAGDDIQFNVLLNRIMDEKTSLEMLKKKLSAQRAKIVEEIDSIPTRIDEVIRQRPEPVDIEAIEAAIKLKEKESQAINKQLTDESEAYKVVNDQISFTNKKLTELNILLSQEKQKHVVAKSEYDNLQMTIKNQIQTATNQLNTYSLNIEEMAAVVNAATEDNKKQDRRIIELREEYHKKLSETIDNDSFICPTCEQHLPENKKAGIIESFEAKKSEQLERIAYEAKICQTKIATNNEIIKTNQAEINRVAELHKAKYEELQNVSGVTQPEFTYDSFNIDMLSIEIEDVKKSIAEFKKPEKTDLSDKLQEIQSEIIALKTQLNKRDDLQKSIDREAELQEQIAELSQEIATIEQELYTIENFETAKYEFIESKVNSLFRFVKFKMFNKLINGSIEQVCQTLVNDVPFETANNAGRINAGIDIINTFSKHLDIFAPIWVDNAESVNAIEKTDSQIIKLVVTNEPLKIN